MQGNISGRPKTVLLIDDEPTWLEAVKLGVRDASFTILTAESGEAALEQMRKTVPDLILSDIRMPVMNGFDLFEKVRSIPAWRKVPYVFMSSIGDFDAKKVARDLGADDFVEKPLRTEEVKAVVLDLLLRFRKTSSDGEK